MGGRERFKQAAIKAMRQGEERRNNPKAQKAYERRRQEEEFVKELRRSQFDRAIGKIFDGTQTEEDIFYVFDNLDRWEEVVYGKRITRRYPGERETVITEVTAGIVNPVRKDSSA